MWARWTRTIVAAIIVAGMVLGATCGWLYWGWKSEQRAVAGVGAMRVKTEPLLGRRVRGWLGPGGWVLDRVVSVELGRPATDADLVYVKEFTRLRELYIVAAKVTDAGLANLEGLKDLRMLSLMGTPVTDSGLAHLRELNRLHWLELGYTKVTDSGLVQLEAIKGLDWLSLEGTKVTDGGLVHLKALKSLQSLNLQFTAVTDAGVKELEAEVPGVMIMLPRVVGEARP